ncbi:calcium/calmodulin-dependent protein kinase kinase [Anaeramoeba flamelloides]|uniref:Calcium/calmodulin-dependent protein kinase kinase n=1 Tax=Anaeramoeba flamelloides TaxID=1746091 RepID=A0ABQ8XN03_9EUKA|nr:calcium/calmodulin-dependent protein kinase kinase [Anaeramoeba flamelloides]
MRISIIHLVLFSITILIFPCLAKYQKESAVFIKTSYLLGHKNAFYLRSERIREDGSFLVSSKIGQEQKITSVPISKSLLLDNNLSKTNQNNSQFYFQNQASDTNKIRNRSKLKPSEPNQDFPLTKDLMLVDPLTYSSYFSGSNYDRVTTFSIGSENDPFTILIAGTTNSPDFPLQNNVEIVSAPDKNDQHRDNIAFVSRIDANGNIIFSTFFGGSISQNEVHNTTRSIKPQRVCRDNLGRFWIVGGTTTEDIPITENSFNKATFDVMEVGFILCLNGEGESIQYSSLFGNCEQKLTRLLSIEPLITDFYQIILIGGTTNSTEDVFKNELQKRNEDISTIYAYVGLLRITVEETELIFGTVFGGTGYDMIESSSAYYLQRSELILWVSGTTSSSDFFDYYSQETSPRAHIINQEYFGDGTTMSFFLQIRLEILEQHQFDAELVSGSLMGHALSDRAHWIQKDPYSNYEAVNISPVVIVGDTYNFDHFFVSDDVIKPEWMANTENKGNSLVGYLTLLNSEGIKFLKTFMVGCHNGQTSISYCFAHHTNSITVTGWTNCSSSDFPLTADIWSTLLNETTPLDQFSYKYFLMKINITKMFTDLENSDYEDYIYYSTFVDGTDNPDLSGTYAAVKTDYYGNIYSAFNVYNEDYLNEKFTENAFLIETIGESSIFIRIYGAIDCNPGSFINSDEKLCIFCPTGSYSSKINSTSCLQCESGKYQSNIGSTKCFDCRDDQVSNEGQTECTSPSAIVPNQLNISLEEIRHNSIYVIWRDDGVHYDYQVSLVGTIGYEMIYLISHPIKIEIDNKKYNSYNFTGLSSSFRYYIRMRSQYENEKEFSSMSKGIIATTYGIPNRVHSQNIQCTCSPHSLELEWPAVPSYQNMENKYYVYYKKSSQSDSPYQQIIANEPRAFIDELDFVETLDIIISAFNAAGEGFESYPKNFSTCSISPDKVQIIKYSSSTDSIKLTWKVPYNGGETITSYQYRIKTDDEEVVNAQKNNDYVDIGLVETYTFENLNSESNYSISINAVNTNGRSDDNYSIYSTSEVAINVVAIALGSFGAFAVVSGGVLWITRNKIIRRKNKIKIKSLIQKNSKNFRKQFKNLIYCTDKTVSFDSLEVMNDSFQNDIIQAIKVGCCVSVNRNWIVREKSTQSGLLFCKLSNSNEVGIHEKIWKIFKKDPSTVPIVKFFSSCVVDSQNFDNLSEKNFKKSYGAHNHNHNYNHNQKKNQNNNNQNSGIGSNSSSNIGSSSSTSDTSDSIISSGSDNSNMMKMKKNDDQKNIRKQKNKLLILEWLPISLFEYNLYRKSKSKPFSEKEKSWIAFNLIHSINFLHNNNIIHRDIKLQNIMIGMDGYLRISDYSSAVQLNDNQNSISDQFVGTQKFFDPKLKPLFNSQNNLGLYQYTKGHDIYALGKTLEKITWETKDFKSEKKSRENAGLKDHLLEKEIETPVLEIIQMCTKESVQRITAPELVDFINPFIARLVLGQK